jgi:hypothetical protein
VGLDVSAIATGGAVDAEREHGLKISEPASGKRDSSLRSE